MRKQFLTKGQHLGIALDSLTEESGLSLDQTKTREQFTMGTREFMAENFNPL